MENSITFGAQADIYAAARPHYPDALFDWIAAQAPGRGLVWDVGTGSGQAAQSLAKRFEQVHATDVDAAQIAEAALTENISFTQSPAHISGLDDGRADAITVATALHWFDFDRFWPEVQRVARPGGIFCAWTYYQTDADEDVNQHLLEPTLDILKPYWSEGNRMSWRGYIQDDINMPFEHIEAPTFACELMWTPVQIAAYMKSWSAHKKARSDGQARLLSGIERAGLAALGTHARRIQLPLHVIAARIE